MIHIISREIESEFANEGNTVPGEMKLLQVGCINNGVEIELGDRLTISIKPIKVACKLESFEIILPLNLFFVTWPFMKMSSYL